MPENKKKIYMWILVFAITAIIGIIWIASVQYSISASIINIGSKSKEGAVLFEEIKDDLKDQMDEAVSLFKKDPLETVSSTSTSEASTSTNIVEEENLN